MLGFEYVHKNDIAVFILGLKEDGLHLDYSDEKSCELLGISYPYTGDELMTKYLSAAVYNHIDHVCRQLNKSFEVYRFTHTNFFKDVITPTLATIIAIIYQGKEYFLFYCTEIKPPILESNTWFSYEVNQTYYNASFDLLFSLQTTPNNDIILLGYNKTFSTFFGINEGQYEYSNLGYVSPPYFAEFINSCAQQALMKGSAISQLFEYQCTGADLAYPLLPKSGNYHLLISFLPVQHGNYQTVLCCARNISDEMQAKNEAKDLLEEYNALFNSTVNAVAVYSCKDPFHPNIERINPKMQQLYDNLEFLHHDSFYRSDIWTRMLETKATAEDTLIVYQAGKTSHLKLILVPVTRNNKLLKAIMTVIDNTEQVVTNLIKNTIKLTPREEEIINHVLAGEKNEFIASQLCISVGTVKRTLSNAYNKLGISSRVELINYYHSNNNDSFRLKITY